MMIFGVSMEQLYMYILLAAGALTVLHVFFGGMIDLGDVLPAFNPTVILAFLTFGAAIGFLLETATAFDEWSVLGLAIMGATLLAILLYFFILLPLSSAESAIVHSEELLSGQVANVIVPIPEDGYGEVVLETYEGTISKRATSYDNEAIDRDEKVTIIEISNDTLYVQVCEPFNVTKKLEFTRGT